MAVVRLLAFSPPAADQRRAELVLHRPAQALRQLNAAGVSCTSGFLPFPPQKAKIHGANNRTMPQEYRSNKISVFQCVWVYATVPSGFEPTFLNSAFMFDTIKLSKHSVLDLKQDGYLMTRSKYDKTFFSS